MNTIIIEDKGYIRKALRNLLQSLDTNIKVVGECESVKEAVIVTKACKPDLIFLDIHLTDGTAFNFLEETETLNFKVIFITAYEEYALKALKIGAVDYLLKPVDPEELKFALKKVNALSVVKQKEQIKEVQQAWNKENNTLILSLQDSFQVIKLSELMYCESDKGYTTFYLSEGKKHIASKPLKEFEQQLLSHNFARPHQSFIINFKFIDKYDKSGIIHLKNGQKVPVSSRKKETFVAKLFNWNKN